MSLKTIILIFGILCYNFNSAQSNNQLKVADSLYNDAINLYSTQKKFKEANLQLEIVDSLYQILNLSKKVFLTKRLKSLCYKAHRSPFEVEIKPLNEGLKFVSKSNRNSSELAMLYIGLSETYNHHSQIDNARHYGLKTLDIINAKENTNINPDIIIANLLILSSIEKKSFNLDLEELYLNKALEATAKYDKNNSRIKLELFANYLSNNKTGKVKEFLKNENENEFLNNARLFVKFDYFLYKIVYYLGSKQFDLALSSANDLEEIVKTSPYKAHFSDLFFIQRKADIYFEMKSYKEAIKIAEPAVNSKDLEMAQNEYRAGIFLTLTKNYLALNNFEKAKENLQEAFGLNYINQKNKDFYDKIEVSEIVKVTGNTLLRLQLKAEICLTEYKQTDKVKYFNATIETYEILNEVIKVLGRKSNEDKFLTEDFFKDTYGNLLDLYHSQWQLNTKNDKIFYKALNVCDESKTIAVLNEIKAVKHSNLFKSVPKDLIDREQGIQLKLDSINRLYFAAKTNKIIAKSKDSLETVFANFKKDLKENQPNYFQLRYGVEAPIKSVIEEKYSDYNILQFFWGEKYIYVFNSNGEKKHFDKIVLSNELNQDIDMLLRAFRDNQSETYKELGQNVYNKLFKKYIDPNKKTAVILDDKLHLLPIEAIYIADQKEYLLEQTSVLRLNSIKQGVILPNDKVQGVKLFAPYTSESLDDNQELRMSLLEVNKISEIFKSEIFLNEKANKEEFLNQLANNRIIHLATHSFVDPNNPMKSKIYFNNYGNLQPSDVVLQIEELYNLNLNTDLVTLSACQTGIGKEIKGKGVMSLSNALSFAGVSSTVMSLWKVPDKETSQVIVSFYEHLNKGEFKDEALRNAKLDYLKSVDDDPILKHPYYWAGFVVSGDMSPIRSNKNAALWIVLGSLIAMLIAFRLYRNRKKNAA